MNRRAILGSLVLPDRVIRDGVVIIADGMIEYAGPSVGVALPETCIDVGDRLVAPGFVDIHCHAGGKIMANDDPAGVAAYQRSHGTTGLLLTFYRNLPNEVVLEAFQKVKACKAPSILGVHMEGPYLNPDYGSKKQPFAPVDPTFYRQLINFGLVRQWTYAPEMEGTSAFAREIAAAGIVPAIGHSAASPAQVDQAVRDGARIVTHLMNATGCSITPTRYGGTIEVSFDIAAMRHSNVFFEVIFDSECIHVRREMVEFIIKSAGIDFVVGITDCMAGGLDDGRDINIDNGELCGSKLTMSGVARNFLSLGLPLHEVFKVVSLNPAKAIRMDHLVGSLTKGRRADLLLIDPEIKNVEVVE